jgi:O-antigen/teichoic acid export membrane protein
VTLPSSISKLQRFKKYLANSGWILADRAFALLFSFIGTVLVARHLGTADFGALSYALAMVGIFGAVGHVGLDALVIRDIVRYPNHQVETLGTSFALKFLGMLLAYGLLFSYAFLFESDDLKRLSMICLAGLLLLFKPFVVIDFWFQAHFKAKYGAIARATSGLCMLVIIVFFVFFGSVSVVYFVSANIAEVVLVALLLIYFAEKKLTITLRSWRFDRERAYALIRQGGLVYLGSILAMVYLKVDIVMLRWLSDSDQVGHYAVAAKLSEAWYVIPAAIVTSIFPRLIELSRENTEAFRYRFQQLLDLLFASGFFVALFVTLAASILVNLIFGADYAGSVSILTIHVWAAVFIFMRAAFSKWILIEDMYYLSLFTQGLGALANVILNAVLIPQYGGIGAAYATLISYALASYFALLFFGRTRPIFWQMSLALLAPVRYPVRYLIRAIIL